MYVGATTPTALHNDRSVRQQGLKGGTSHLHDKVRIDLRTVDDNEPLIFIAKDIFKAFGGWVRGCPGLMTMLTIRLDQLGILVKRLLDDSVHHLPKAIKSFVNASKSVVRHDENEGMLFNEGELKSFSL
jgi:hypothetical protein